MATCFVVQGFGKKTDYTGGRVLDLDASYAVIKEAVIAAGLQCIRCDEIVHAGIIDAPTYEQLMRANLVIADLSTSNINAAFELGVRYGLKPYATIIVAEEGFEQPFDVSHSVIRRYKHLGGTSAATRRPRRRSTRSPKGRCRAACRAKASATLRNCRWKRRWPKSTRQPEKRAISTTHASC